MPIRNKNLNPKISPKPELKIREVLDIQKRAEKGGLAVGKTGLQKILNFPGNLKLQISRVRAFEAEISDRLEEKSLAIARTVSEKFKNFFTLERELRGVRGKIGAKLLSEKWSEWKFQRMRAKILKTENSRRSLKVFLKRSFRKVYLKKGLAFVTIVAVIVTAYWQNIPPVEATTYTWLQTDWSSGSSGTGRTHAQELSSPGGWTYYNNNPAKDANVSATTSLTLTTTPGTDVDDADGDFSETHSQTVVDTGYGRVKLQANPGTINTGDGTDGAVTINSATNLNTQDTNATTDGNGASADGVNWSITSDISAGATTISSGITRPAGFVVGDEILIITLRGTTGDDPANVGLYEFTSITALPTTTSISVSPGLTNAYTGTTRKVMVQRVPNYTDVSIDTGGSLTCSAWNATAGIGGVLAFRANGTVTVNVANGIHTNALGLPGGAAGAAYTGNAGGGQSYNGTGGSGGAVSGVGLSLWGGGGGGGSNNNGLNCIPSAGGSGTTGNGAGGGAGGFGQCIGSGGEGGGGGHGSPGYGSNNGGIPVGGTGGSGTTNCHGGSGGGGGNDGRTADGTGSATLNQRAYLGGGGGAGGGAKGGDCYYSPRTSTGGGGGSGGGIIFISANGINISSGASINSNGQTPATPACPGGFEAVPGNGGGGAGGSLILFANSISNSGDLVANGAVGASSVCMGGGVGYTGGGGRTHARYSSFSGTNPTPNYSPSPYFSSGTYTSGTVDASALITSGTLSWDKTDNSGSITTEIKGATTSGALSGKSWCSITSGASVFSVATSCVETNSRYFQYRATLNASGDLTQTPWLNSTTLSYNYYLTNQTLTSSTYDSNDVSNKITSVSWNEDTTLPANTEVKLQVRSSSDGATWTMPWQGSGGDNTYFTNSASGCSKPSGTTVTCTTIPSVLTDYATGGTSDKFVQYKVTLTSAGANTATLADVTLSYQYNTAPTIANFTAPGQNSSGQVAITYDISDDAAATDRGVLFYQPSGVQVTSDNGTNAIVIANPDSLTLPSSGYVFIGTDYLNYSNVTGNGSTSVTLTGTILRGQALYSGFPTASATHSASDPVYFKATAATGTGVDAVTVTTSPVSKAVTWTPKNETNPMVLNRTYTGMSLKIVLHDGQTYNFISSITQAGFTVDLVNPTISAITSVAGDISAPYYDTTNDSSTAVVYTSSADANTCKWNTTDVAYDSMSNTCASTSSCTLNLSGEGSKTVYMRCMDNSGNKATSSTSLTYIIDSIAPSITAITSVAGDATAPYYDTTNDSSTAVVYTSSADAVTCKWNTTDAAYDSMSNTCASTSSCTLNLAGEGAKTAYLRCMDTAGNKATSSYILNYTIDITPPSITAITSVAGDTAPTYYDTTNDSSTAVVYTSSADSATCKWSTTDVAYDSMANTCASTSSCTLNLSGDGAKTAYLRCMDNAGNKATSSYTLNYTVDSIAPLFTMQYYSDTNLTNSLGTNPRLKTGTYYIKLSASETLLSAPTVSIAAEGTANDVPNGSTVSVSGNDYKYTRTIASDGAAIGTTLEDISVTAADLAGNPANNVSPTDEATKAGYTDTTNPVISAVAPATGAYINSITSALGGSDVSYTLDEAIQSGTIDFVRTGGTADGGTHHCVLKSPAFSSGAHNNIELSAVNCVSAQSLVDNTIYKVDFNGIDLAGNAATQVENTNVTFNSIAPAAAVTYNPNRPVKAGDSLQIDAAFSAVMLDSPPIKIAISGANTVAATNMTKVDTTHYTYTYNVTAGNGTATVALSNGTDQAGNVVASDPLSGATYTVDNTAPILQSFNSSTANGTYGTNDNIVIQAVFDNDIQSGATMTVKLNNTAERQVTLNQVSGSTLYGTYIVIGPGSGQTDDSADLSIAQIMSASVTDIAGNNSTGTTIPGGQNLADNKDLVVDTVPPTLVSFTAPSGNYNGGDNIVLTANYNKFIKSNSQIHLKINGNNDGTTINLTTVSGATVYGTYTVQAGDNAQNLKVDSIVSQSVFDMLNNELNDTVMPGANIADGAQVDTIDPVISFTDDIYANPAQSDTVTLNVVETNPAEDKYVWSTDTDCASKNYSAGAAFTSDTPILMNTETNDTKYLCARVVDQAGNIGYRASEYPLNIDISPPTGTLSFDRTLSSSQITLTAADSGRNLAGLQMQIVRLEDGTAGCDFDSATWEDYSTPHDFSSSSDFIKACVRYKDIADNISGTISAAPPKTPESFNYYDVSNPNANDYRIFLSWKKPEGADIGSKGFYQYKVFRCVVPKAMDDCAPDTDLYTISGIGSNYQPDEGLDDAHKYCYKVKFLSGDAALADHSVWSETRCVVPSSGANSLLAPVKIQNLIVPDSEVYAAQATLYWRTINEADGTDLPADSQVCWRESGTTNYYCRSSDTQAINHKETISKAVGDSDFDLKPNKDYEYKVKSTTLWDTTDEEIGSGIFHTKNGPVITNIASSANNTDAAVSWSTSIAANSSLYYSVAKDNGELASPTHITDGCTDTGAGLEHTCALTNLSMDITYYFYVESSGNGATAQDKNGGEFYNFRTKKDETPPTIETDPNLTNPVTRSDTQTTLAYYTAERSQSRIGWKKSTDSSYTYQSWGSNFNNNHLFTLNNLDPDTAYDYIINAKDASSNLATPVTGTFTTLQAQVDHTPLAEVSPDTKPTIIQYANNEAIVSYDAKTQTNARLCYGTSATDDGDMDSCANGLTSLANTAHYFHLENLSAHTLYHLKAKVTDIDDGDDTHISDEETFTTRNIPVQQHAALSTITTPGPGDITAGTTYAYVSWTTDQPASSDLSCTDGVDIFSAPTDDSLNIKHILKLTGLTADTEYTCTVSSTDDLPAPTTLTSQPFSFTTNKGAEYQHDPLTKIENIETSLVTDENAVINFTTDQGALCLLESTTSKNIYTNPLLYYEDNYEADENFSLNHSIKLTGLIFSTTYYYRITCHDNLGTTPITQQDDDNQIFTTLETQIGTSEIPGGDATAPVISNVSTGTITGESVTITWDTDEKANSLVQYGIKSGVYDSGGSNNDVNSDVTNYVDAHSVIINNLVPGTKYYYKAMSNDAAGNIGTSSEQTFTTKATSNISSIKPISTKLGEVTITWKTSAKTTSIVEYGITTTYGESKESTTFATDHEVTISGLKQSTEYHFMVKGKDQDNNIYASGDNSFTPKSPPTIINVKLSSSTEHEATISFTTSTATDALITYTNTQDSKDTGSQGNPTLTTNHTLTLKNLAAGTTYSYTITAKDIDGNSTTDPSTSSGQALSTSSGQAGSTRTFTTGVDTIPPKIDQVRTDSALAQNDKVQTIISWTTDELANTALIYKEGQGAEPREVKISDNPTTNHIAVITIFKPGTVYYFKVKSTDLSGNSATSSDFALLTPKRKENIIQIIISNFQDIFGWAKF